MDSYLAQALHEAPIGAKHVHSSRQLCQMAMVDAVDRSI